MLLCKIHEAFRNIVYLDHFQRKSHVYLNTETHKIITSATQTLGLFSPPFPPEMLAKKAKEKNISPSELQVFWTLLKDFGTGKGSYVHDYLENRVNRRVLDQPLPPVYHTLDTTYKSQFSTQLHTCLNQAKQFIYENPHYIPFKQELVLGNDIIAGQLDNLSYNTKTGNYIIIDYKTDKQINFDSLYNKFFFEPLSHLAYCEYNKYSLQLSIYRYLLELYTDIKLDPNIIVWFNPKNSSYRIIEVPYLKDEIHGLLKLRATQIQ